MHEYQLSTDFTGYKSIFPDQIFDKNQIPANQIIWTVEENWYKPKISYVNENKREYKKLIMNFPLGLNLHPPPSVTHPPFCGFVLFSSLISHVFFLGGSPRAHPTMFPAARWRPPSAKYRFGGYCMFCAILFHIIVYCWVDQHVCTFRCVNQNCIMTFTPAHVCAFLGCSPFLCKCMHMVSILPLPHHPIHSWPQDMLSLGANRPLSLSGLPLSPTLPWSGHCVPYTLSMILVTILERVFCFHMFFSNLCWNKCSWHHHTINCARWSSSMTFCVSLPIINRSLSALFISNGPARTLVSIYNNILQCKVHITHLAYHCIKQPYMIKPPQHI